MDGGRGAQLEKSQSLHLSCYSHSILVFSIYLCMSIRNSTLKPGTNSKLNQAADSFVQSSFEGLCCKDEDFTDSLGNILQ